MLSVPSQFASPLILSISESRQIVVEGITYDNSGEQADPCSVYTPSFQLLAPTASLTFGSWTTGQWESATPTTEGPYAASIVVGASQSAPVNPDREGPYLLYMKMVSSQDSPIFLIGTIIFEAP